MSGLRVVPFRQFRKVLERSGYAWVRCTGSHHVFRHADGRVVVLPDHGSHDITRALTRKILRDTGLGMDEYHRLLDE